MMIPQISHHAEGVPLEDDYEDHHVKLWLSTRGMYSWASRLCTVQVRSFAALQWSRVHCTALHCDGVCGEGAETARRLGKRQLHLQIDDGAVRRAARARDGADRAVRVVELTGNRGT